MIPFLCPGLDKQLLLCWCQLRERDSPGLEFLDNVNVDRAEVLEWCVIRLLFCKWQVNHIELLIVITVGQGGMLF